MITLVYCNGRYMTFSAKDYIALRRDHRINGTLIGVVANKAYDSTLKGLPAVYSACEAKLLIDEGIVQVKRTPNGPPDESLQENYTSYMDGITEQLEGRKLIQIPTACPYANAIDHEDIPAPNPDPLKYAVFRDLWRRKFTITGGTSFGGDFLIYPQDPIICHASHVVQVLAKPTITAQDFIQANRLAVGVRKDCLFAYQTTDQEIVYHKSRWDSSWCS